MEKTSRSSAAFSKRIFICYKRSAHPDHELATALYGALRMKGHEPFIDKVIAVGTNWEVELEARIREADLFIVLLSGAALKSPIIVTEIEVAQEASLQCGTPHIIQVRIDFEEKLPFSLRFLNRYQYAEWNSEHDTDRVLDEVVEAVQRGGLRRSEAVEHDLPPQQSRDASVPLRARKQAPRKHPMQKQTQPLVNTPVDRPQQGPTVAVQSLAAQEVRTALAPYVSGVHPLEEGAFLTLFADKLHRTLIEITYAGAQPNEAADQTLSEIRAEAVRQGDYLNRLRTDRPLEELFNDIRDLIDDWSKRCQEIEEVDRLTEKEVAQVEQAAAKRHRQASDMQSGWQAFGVAYENSRTYFRTSGQIREQGEDRKSEVHRSFLTGYSAAWSRARQTATELCALRGWRQVEKAFDGSIDQRHQMAIWRSSDLGRYQDALNRMVAQQPMNPFLLSLHCAEVLTAPSATHDTLAPLVAQVATSVLLVPVSREYDEQRGGMLFLAAHFIANTVGLHQAGRLTGSTSVAMAEQALRVMDVLETHFPLWPDPYEIAVQSRMTLLGAANRLREAYEYGLRHKDRIWKVGAGCYNFACYASLLGQCELAWKYLEHAFRNLGYEHVKHAAADPDLDPLRRAKSEEWSEFFTVRVRARIDHGLFLDDVTLENSGSFPFTNVRLTCYTHYVNGKCNTIELTAARINPGATQTWSDVVSVPGMKFTTSVLRCYLNSDQADGWINQGAKAAGET